MSDEIKPIEKLSLFDESKSAIEGQKNFRENAAYSWSWLVQNTKETNKIILGLNQLISKSNKISTDIDSTIATANELNLNIPKVEKYLLLQDFKEEIIGVYDNLQEVLNAKNVTLELINQISENIEKLTNAGRVSDLAELRIYNLEQKELTNHLKLLAKFKILE